MANTYSTELKREFPAPPESISLRDWFAGQALAGFLGHPEDTGKSDIAAKYAYEIADAMLAQREK